MGLLMDIASGHAAGGNGIMKEILVLILLLNHSLPMKEVRVELITYIATGTGCPSPVV